MRYHKPEWVKEKQRLILEFLQDGTPPFLSLAAERARVNRHTVQRWLGIGDLNPEHELHGEWTLTVRAIRADYMAQLAKQIQAEDLHAPAGKQSAWILQRLDRDLFDPPKMIHEKTPQLAGDAPAPVQAQVTEQLVSDLAQPELDPSKH